MSAGIHALQRNRQRCAPRGCLVAGANRCAALVAARSRLSTCVFLLAGHVCFSDSCVRRVDLCGQTEPATAPAEEAEVRSLINCRVASAYPLSVAVRSTCSPFERLRPASCKCVRRAASSAVCGAAGGRTVGCGMNRQRRGSLDSVGAARRASVPKSREAAGRTSSESGTTTTQQDRTMTDQTCGGIATIRASFVREINEIGWIERVDGRMELKMVQSTCT